MPIHKNPDGTWQWGKSGKKYKKYSDAVKQMKAIFASGYKEGGQQKKACMTYTQAIRKIAAQKWAPPSMADVYNAIRRNQTGHKKGMDAWIRTQYAPEQGSTAFGPAQLGSILKTKLDKARFKTKQQYDDLQGYRQQLLAQRKLFNDYGYNPKYMAANPGAKDPRKQPGYSKDYDYGGKGNPALYNTPEQRMRYHKLAMYYLKDIYDKASKAKDKAGFYNTIAKLYHGGNDPAAIAEYSRRLQLPVVGGDPRRWHLSQQKARRK